MSASDTLIVDTMSLLISFVTIRFRRTSFRKIIHIKSLVSDAFPELFRGIRALKFSHFAVHLRFRDCDAGVGGVVGQNLIIDKLVQDIQFEAQGFFLTGRVGRRTLPASVGPLNLIAVDGLAIDLGQDLAI